MRTTFLSWIFEMGNVRRTERKLRTIYGLEPPNHWTESQDAQSLLFWFQVRGFEYCQSVSIFFSGFFRWHRNQKLYLAFNQSKNESFDSWMERTLQKTREQLLACFLNWLLSGLRQVQDTPLNSKSLDRLCAHITKNICILGWKNCNFWVKFVAVLLPSH